MADASAMDDMSALFDELNAAIPDERVTPSDKQKTILHLNGVRPSEYVNGFSSAAAMNAFVSDKVEAGKDFYQVYGQQPADGVVKELFEEWRVPFVDETLTRKESYQLLQRHGGGALAKDLSDLYVRFGIDAARLQNLSQTKASAVLQQFATMSKPAHNNYLPMFESVCATIQDETMFVSARQKVLLHMNGVMPSEYAGGFPGAAALNNFIDAKIEQSKAFSENFNGAKPADGAIKEILLRWGIAIDPAMLSKDDMYKQLQRHGGGARVRQLNDLYLEFGIPAEKLQSLSESKATQIIQQFNARIQATKRAREEAGTGGANNAPAAESAAEPPPNFTTGAATAPAAYHATGVGVASGGSIDAAAASAAPDLAGAGAGMATPSAAPPPQRRRRAANSNASARASARRHAGMTT